jgi:multicomponent K+:H+ antiporter subunit A
MRLPVEVLVFGCMIVGMLPAATIGPFLDVAVRSVLGTATPEYSLAVWHGFNLPLVMSLIALAGGVALYLLLQRHLNRGGRHAAAARPGRPPHLRPGDGLPLLALARTLERLLGTSGCRCSCG